MILIPAIQQNSSNYTFATMNLGNDDFQNSLAIVIRDNHTYGLRFDWLRLPQLNWQHVEGRPDIKHTEFRIDSGHTVFIISMIKLHSSPYQQESNITVPILILQVSISKGVYRLIYLSIIAYSCNSIFMYYSQTWSTQNI